MIGVGTPRSKWWTVPCPAFLITHPKAGPMLVDTGLHPSVAAKPRENMGRAWARFGRPRIEPGRDVPAQLRERGIEARDLPLVVMTHLHQDHASGMSEFPNSTFVISAAEWHAATTDPRPMLRGYRPAHYDYVFDYRTVSYEGPGHHLIFDLRPHLRPVRRRQRAARLHPRTLGGPPERDRPPAQSRLRDRGRRHLHARPARERHRSRPRPSTVTRGGAPARSWRCSRASTPRP